MLALVLWGVLCTLPALLGCWGEVSSSSGGHTKLDGRSCSKQLTQRVLNGQPASSLHAITDLFVLLPCDCLLLHLQECFSAGYASFNLEPVQYSTTAAAGYAEANKYDPKGVDKYGHEAMPAKVGDALDVAL